MYQPPANPPGFNGDAYQQTMQGMQQGNQHHVFSDAALVIGAGMIGYEAYQRGQQVRALMTPPERDAYDSRAGWRVLRRIVWTMATVLLTLSPWFTGFWTFFLPVASIAVAIWVRLRWRSRFLRSRRAAWESWYRSQGTSVAEMAAFYQAEQRKQAANAQAQHQAALGYMQNTIKQWP